MTETAPSTGAASSEQKNQEQDSRRPASYSTAGLGTQGNCKTADGTIGSVQRGRDGGAHETTGFHTAGRRRNDVACRCARGRGAQDLSHLLDLHRLRTRPVSGRLSRRLAHTG